MTGAEEKTTQHKDDIVEELTVKNLLEAGVHFGHQARRWNPKMKKYIFTERNGIYIIDIQKTLELINKACAAIREIAATGKPILYVGTKPQASPIVKEEAERCGQFYVHNRWLGGMLTNYRTIRQSIKRLEHLEKMVTDGTSELLTKKEVLSNEKHMKKLEELLGGIRKMNRLPGLLVVVDTKRENIAIREANRLGIPVCAIVDTNSNPDLVTYPIPGNDDAIRSIRIILSKITDAVLEGLQLRVDEEAVLAKEIEETVHDSEAYTVPIKDDVTESDVVSDQPGIPLKKKTTEKTADEGIETIRKKPRKTETSDGQDSKRSFPRSQAQRQPRRRSSRVPASGRMSDQEISTEETTSSEL